MKSEKRKSAAVLCGGCKRAFAEKDVYTVDGSRLCEDCAIEAGLYPLEHTGSRRDRISERGRRLTAPQPDAQKHKSQPTNQPQTRLR
jgi:hypothetical protein